MKKWRCSICGYIHVGDEPPEECPVCGADSSKFEEFVEEKDASVIPPQEEKVVPQKDSGMFDRIVEMMLQNHLHPITVHTPNGIVPAAALFLFLAVALKMSSFELPAFYNMIFVLLAMPIVLFSGYIEWQKHYSGAKTSVFFTKITCGAVVLVSLLAVVSWRIIDPDVASVDSSARWVYFLLHIVALSGVGLAGHLGGKLVFNRER